MGIFLQITRRVLLIVFSLSITIYPYKWLLHFSDPTNDRTSSIPMFADDIEIMSEGIILLLDPIGV
ncbi:hypothetical protein S96127_0448 [Yersinia pestis]|nr:hypothetical protein S96127_0448 [Yersinia pestis]